jgi:outer membrane protein assembly factor BamA
MLPRMRPILSFLLLAAASASAQTLTPRTIAFDGAPQYAPADLLALSGLSPGKVVSKEDIETAMHHLDDSGLFSGIQYTTGNFVLRFQLEPTAADHMRRVAYTNFAWYTNAELNAAIHSKLPLFTGVVPIDGDMAGKVTLALEAILKNRGIDATVKSIGSSGGTLDFGITSPRVVVGNLLVEDARLDSDASLTAVSSRVAGSDYVEGISAEALRKSLSDAYLDLGFLDETVGPIGHAIPRIERDRIAIDLTGTAKLGQQYKVSRLVEPGPSGGVTAKELDSAMQLKTGAIASRIELLSTVSRLQRAFTNHGFLDATTTVEPTKDGATHTIAYTFTTVPGELYRMRKLGFGAGTTSTQQSQLTQSWKLAKGAVYEAVLVGRTVGVSPASTMCGGKPVSVGLLPDKATHEVDINLGCPQRPGLTE